VLFPPLSLCLCCAVWIQTIGPSSTETITRVLICSMDYSYLARGGDQSEYLLPFFLLPWILLSGRGYIRPGTASHDASRAYTLNVVPPRWQFRLCVCSFSRHFEIIWALLVCCFDTTFLCLCRLESTHQIMRRPRQSKSTIRFCFTMTTRPEKLAVVPEGGLDTDTPIDMSIEVNGTNNKEKERPKNITTTNITTN
jgi:hypothetical protein